MLAYYYAQEIFCVPTKSQIREIVDFSRCRRENKQSFKKKLR